MSYYSNKDDPRSLLASGRWYTTRQDSGIWKVACLLCNNTEHDKVQYYADSRHEAHNTHTHQQFYSYLSRNGEMPAWDQRATKLGATEWRRSIQARQYEYLTTGNASTKMEIDHLLEKYELMDQLTVLELAVWRFACQRSTLTLCCDILDSQLWLSNGWKESKTAQRNSNTIHVVLTSVVPFLKHWKDQELMLE